MSPLAAGAIPHLNALSKCTYSGHNSRPDKVLLERGIRRNVFEKPGTNLKRRQPRLSQLRHANRRTEIVRQRRQIPPRGSTHGGSIAGLIRERRRGSERFFHLNEKNSASRAAVSVQERMDPLKTDMEKGKGRQHLMGIMRGKSIVQHLARLE